MILTVLNLQFSRNVPGTSSSVGASYKFNCSGKQGAVVVLGDWGIMSHALKNSVFRPYMSKHHSSWHQFATSKGLAVEETDLVLISSFVKTSQWALAAFSSQKKSVEVSFNASIGPFASAQFGLSYGEGESGSIPQRRGPRMHTTGSEANSADSVAPLLPNQCLFIRYHKLKKKKLIRLPWITAEVKAKDAIGSPEEDYQRSSSHLRPPSSSSGTGGSISRSISGSSSKSSNANHSDDVSPAVDTPASSFVDNIEDASSNVSFSSTDTESPPAPQVCSFV